MSANFTKIPFANPIRLLDLAAGDEFYFLSLPGWEQSKKYCQKFEQQDYLRFQVGIVKSGTTAVVANLVSEDGTATYPITVTELVFTGYDPYTIYECYLSLTGVAEGYYFVEVECTEAPGMTTDLISEPLEIRSEHPDTIQLRYRNSVNDFDMVFYTGSMSREVYCIVRSEGGLATDGFTPASKDVTYRNQNYDIVALDSIPFNVYRWTFGDTNGIPNYLADIINRLLSFDTVYIEGLQYIKNEGAKLEPQRDKGYPLAAWTIELLKKKEVVYSRYFASRSLADMIEGVKVDLKDITADSVITVNHGLDKDNVWIRALTLTGEEIGIGLATNTDRNTTEFTLSEGYANLTVRAYGFNDVATIIPFDMTAVGQKVTTPALVAGVSQLIAHGLAYDNIDPIKAIVPATGEEIGCTYLYTPAGDPNNFLIQVEEDYPDGLTVLLTAFNNPSI